MNELTFRALTPQEVKEEFPKVFLEVEGGEVLEEQFNWKYLEVPASLEVKVWGCFVGNDLAGVSSTLRRHYVVNGVESSCHMLYDSFIRPSFQRKGIYKKQLNFLVDLLKKEGSEFIFAFTNEKSSAVIGQLDGARNIFPLNACILPIGFDFVSKKLIGRTLPGVSVLVRSFVKACLRRNKDISMQRIAEPEVANYSLEPTLLRTQDFLAWKAFKTPPSLNSNVLNFRFQKSGEVIGYCVLFRDIPNNRMKILDIDGKSHMKDCLREICHMAISEKLDSVMSVMSGTKHYEALRSAGFIKVKSVRLTLIKLNGDEVGNIYLSPIDRDNFFY